MATLSELLAIARARLVADIAAQDRLVQAAQADLDLRAVRKAELEAQLAGVDRMGEPDVAPDVQAIDAKLAPAPEPEPEPEP